jgi:hypothetical protein
MHTWMIRSHERPPAQNVSQCNNLSQPHSPIANDQQCGVVISSGPAKPPSPQLARQTLPLRRRTALAAHDALVLNRPPAQEGHHLGQAPIGDVLVTKRLDQPQVSCTAG